jgi:hypothetical protein
VSEDVGKVITNAWKAVGVPESLYETAFNRALDLIVGGSAPTPQPPITPPVALTPAPSTPGTTPSVAPVGATGDENDFFTKLVAATKVSRPRLESLVHLDEGVPKMAVHTSTLPKGKKPGQLFIARIILTARFVWLGETEVALSEVRPECDRYGVLDSNFSTNVKSLNGAGITISGSSRAQKAKVRQSYIDSFAQFLIDTLGEESGPTS